MTNFERILVPLDGSPLSEKALAPAITLAQKFNSQIILLYVVDLPAMALPAVQMEHPPSWSIEVHEYAHQEAENYLKSHQEKLRQQGCRVEILIKDMSPAERIIEAAQDADLTIMSTHGRGGLTRWALGSVTDKVVRHSACPVLLIRQEEEENP